MGGAAGSDREQTELQIPPLRCAPVGMTIKKSWVLELTICIRAQLQLCRPERFSLILAPIRRNHYTVGSDSCAAPARERVVAFFGAPEGRALTRSVGWAIDYDARWLIDNLTSA